MKKYLYYVLLLFVAIHNSSYALLEHLTQELTGLHDQLTTLQTTLDNLSIKPSGPTKFTNALADKDKLAFSDLLTIVLEKFDNSLNENPALSNFMYLEDTIKDNPHFDENFKGNIDQILIKIWNSLVDNNPDSVQQNLDNLADALGLHHINIKDVRKTEPIPPVKPRQPGLISEENKKELIKNLISFIKDSHPPIKIAGTPLATLIENIKKQPDPQANNLSVLLQYYLQEIANDLDFNKPEDAQKNVNAFIKTLGLTATINVAQLRSQKPVEPEKKPTSGKPLVYIISNPNDLTNDLQEKLRKALDPSNQYTLQFRDYSQTLDDDIDTLLIVMPLISRLSHDISSQITYFKEHSATKQALVPFEIRNPGQPFNSMQEYITTPAYTSLPTGVKMLPLHDKRIVTDKVNDTIVEDNALKVLKSFIENDIVLIN